MTFRVVVWLIKDFFVIHNDTYTYHLPNMNLTFVLREIFIPRGLIMAYVNRDEFVCSIRRCNHQIRIALLNIGEKYDYCTTL